MTTRGPRGLARAGVMLFAVALVATACSTKSKDSGGGTKSGGVKTDVGVTAKKITLGDLTDLSGVFAVLGKSVTQGNQVYFDKVNRAGGICGRSVELIVRDHGYDVQKAVGAYAEIQPKVLGLAQSLGSPMNAALLDSFKSDNLLVAPASWASTLLSVPNIQISGATYDIEVLNGIDYLLKAKGLKEGDTVGHIYFEGEYGANGLLGSQYAEKQGKIKLVAVKIKATDTDMSSQVTSLKAAGAKAIILTTGPKQAASAAGVAKAIGLNVPILGNNPTYLPALLKTPAGPALQANFYLSTSGVPFSAASPAAMEVAAAYKAKFPGEVPNQGVDYGYGVAQIYTQVLKKACDAKDLSRAGVLKAFQGTSNADTGGLIATLDFSQPGAPPSRETYIQRPDPSVEGGLKIAQELTESDLARQYKAPAQK